LGIALAAVYMARSEVAAIDLPAAISQEEYDRAARAWHVKHGSDPEPDDVFASLGDALALDGKLEQAIACYQKIPTDHPTYGLGARLEQGKALIVLARAREAEENLRAFLGHIEEDSTVRKEKVAEALDLLRFLMEVQLRFEERAEILRAIHLLGAGGVFETLAYAFPSTLRWNGPQATQWLEKFWKEDPHDFRLRVALGRYRTGEGRLEEAQNVLEQCCQERPKDLFAQAALIACYYEQNQWEQIEDAFARLPPRSPADPWLLLRMRGHYHNHRHEFAVAIQCFEQALASDAANAESFAGMAKAYEGLGREADRGEALRKVQAMARLQSRLALALSRENDAAPLLEIAQISQEIALWRQARLAATMALKLDPKNVDAQKLLAALPPDGSS
jgi:tetratricopeptide (TPR) repeat protein